MMIIIPLTIFFALSTLYFYFRTRTINKVEIVINTNQEPARIARLAAQELLNIATVNRVTYMPKIEILVDRAPEEK